MQIKNIDLREQTILKVKYNNVELFLNYLFKIHKHETICETML